MALVATAAVATVAPLVVPTLDTLQVVNIPAAIALLTLGRRAVERAEPPLPRLLTV